MNPLKLSLGALLMTSFAIVTAAAPAEAAGCDNDVSFDVVAGECSTGQAEALPSNPGTEGEVRVTPVCDGLSAITCPGLPCPTNGGGTGNLFEVYVGGEYRGTQCIGEAGASDAGVITPGQVLRAMRNLDWPASELVIQPPDGLTLVNLDTNFYTTSTEPVTRQVTLLGQRITIEARPAEYQWTFGDGRSLASTEPGAAYPALTITHNYERKGTYRPRLDTVYSGRFRVGGGAWQEIPGTHTVTGSPQRLRAIEAQPKLVGY